MPALWALLWIWSIPQIVVGAILVLVGRPYDLRWHEGVLEVGVRWIAGFSTTTGQTWGRIVLFKAFPPGETIEKHELNHVHWCDILGPLWGPAYVGASLLALIQGKRIYEDNWFEIKARQAAGQ